jgi:hypothetical protein
MMTSCNKATTTRYVSFIENLYYESFPKMASNDIMDLDDTVMELDDDVLMGVWQGFLAPPPQVPCPAKPPLTIVPPQIKLDDVLHPPPIRRHNRRLGDPHIK